MQEQASWRKATLLDIPAVLAIEREAVGAPQWSEALWRRTLEEMAEPRREVLVSESSGRVCGFIVASVVEDVAELESVVVAVEARRQGIGRELCARAMEWAKKCGAKEMELEVRASNTTARRLYVAMRFVEQGLRAKYYQTPEEDAVLMAARL